jgi:hypothetical protein
MPPSNAEVHRTTLAKWTLELVELAVVVVVNAVRSQPLTVEVEVLHVSVVEVPAGPAVMVGEQFT